MYEYYNFNKSNTFKCFVFLLIILVQNSISISATDICSSFPISLSSITNCVSGVCSLEEQAILKIPAHTGATGCVELIMPDEEGTVYRLDIRTNSFYYSSKPDYCYFTDDIAVDAKCFCSCPGGTPIPHENCPVSVTYSDYISTSEIVVKDQYCPLTALFGTPGKYCSKLSVSGTTRFKICHYTKYTELANFEISLANTTFPISYAGEPAGVDLVNVTAHPGLTVNVTVIDDTTIPAMTPAASIIDSHQPSDWYLFSDMSDVNGLNEYDYNKIGFYKSNQTQKLPANLMKSVNFTPLDCPTNKCKFDLPWQSTVKRLIEKQQTNLAGKILPDSILIDNLTVKQQDDIKEGDLRHSVDPYFYMKEGIMWYDYSGNVRFCGVDTNDRVVRGTALSNVCFKGMLEGSETVVVRNVTEMHVCELDSNLQTIGLFLVDGEYTWAMSVPDATYPPAIKQGFASIMTATTTLCGSAKRTFMNPFKWTDNDGPWRLFPTRMAHSISYSSTSGFELSPAHIGNTTTQLWVPSLKGEIEVSLRFKGLKIQFIDQNVRPELLKAGQDTFEIYIEAKSLTSPGDCFISTDPGTVISAQSITLQNVPTTYRYPISTSYHAGPVTVILSCARQQVTKVIQVEINKIERIVDFQTSNDTWIDTLDTINPMNFFRSAENAYDGARWTWWDWVKLVVFIAFAAIAITIITTVIYKIYMCIRPNKMVTKTY